MGPSGRIRFCMVSLLTILFFDFMVMYFADCGVAFVYVVIS